MSSFIKLQKTSDKKYKLFQSLTIFSGNWEARDGSGWWGNFIQFCYAGTFDVLLKFPCLFWGKLPERVEFSQEILEISMLGGKKLNFNE